MFGYVNANKQEMTEEQKIKYQSFYCGLCHKLGEKAGHLGQILLNYDMTFLIILLSGLYEPEESVEEFTCAMHPLSKKQSRQNEFSSYAADMDIILSYYNFLDDYRDEGSRLKKKFMDALQPEYDRIKEIYPRQVAAVEEYIDKLSSAERCRESNLDKVMNYTGQMMEELFCYEEDDLWNEQLRQVGFYLGKYIYMLDAYEDREKDMKSGSYNPLIPICEQCADSYEVFCQQTLMTLMAECARAFERLPIVENADILRNIIYSGVWTKYEYHKIKTRTKEEKDAKKHSGKNKE